MLRNYITIAFRNLRKNLIYTLINALGLSIGMASCLFIFVITQHEFGFDQYHKNIDRIYRLTDFVRVASGEQVQAANVPIPWAPTLAKDYPEIEDFARMVRIGHSIRHNDNTINEGVVYADSSIFQIFSYQLLQGDPKTVLRQPNSLVLAEAAAFKYFGDENPIGKTLTLDNEYSFVVTGVIADLPDNSSYRFTILASFNSLENTRPQVVSDWRSHWSQTYFLLKPNADPEALDARLPEFIKSYIEPEYQERYRPVLQSFATMHFSDLSNDPIDNMDLIYLFVFASIAVFILVIACINFMNLATAKSVQRAREVGLRKVMGAFRTQLVRQFLAETILVAFIALFFAIIFVELALPAFAAIAPRSIEVNYIQNFPYLAALIGITLLVGGLAGSYPAFVLSGFVPAAVLKSSESKSTRGGKLRRVLVIAQFTFALFMIIANLFFFKQINFMKNKDLGFNKDNVLSFIAPRDNNRDRQAAVKHELLQHPRIRLVTQSSHEPGDGYAYGRFIPAGSSETDGMMLPNIAIDPDYVATMELELIAGRNFSANIASDSTESLIVNETAVKQFGWDDPIGQEIRWLNRIEGKEERRRVIGVVRDFHFESLHNPIRPAILHYTPDRLYRYLIRAEAKDLEGTETFVKEKWSAIDPTRRPIHYVLAVDLALEYDFEEVIASMTMSFTVLTIFIACLGLLGLSAFSAQQRSKEFGVRRVLGASVSGIVFLLSRDFSKMIAVSFVLAAPLAGYAMHAYFQNFAYRTAISADIFIAAGLGAILLAWFTISYQSIKAALANPIDSLRQD